MTARDGIADTVDIITTMFNGERYVAELVASIQAQSHVAWRLWVRDDGSTDSTREIVRTIADLDARVVPLKSDGERLGPAAGFDWLLARVPAEARYVMCADQDDVWLPDKIAVTLSAMRAAEETAPGPVLAHTDLVVVDDALREIAPSFWRFSGVDPEPVSLRRLMVQNVATGATVMLNRPLRELVGRLPPGAVYHDWWYACVAVAFGRIVAVRQPTMLYRQHGANVVGAARSARARWRDLPFRIGQALAQTAHLQSQIERTTRQAAAFLLRFDPLLSEGDRRFLRAYARLQEHGFFRRKVELARLRLRREHGFWRNLGILLRA